MKKKKCLALTLVFNGAVLVTGGIKLLTTSAAF